MNKSTQRRVLLGKDFNQLAFVAVPAFGYELKSFIQSCYELRSFIQEYIYIKKFTKKKKV